MSLQSFSSYNGSPSISQSAYKFLALAYRVLHGQHHYIYILTRSLGFLRFLRCCDLGQLAVHPTTPKIQGDIPYFHQNSDQWTIEFKETIKFDMNEIILFKIKMSLNYLNHVSITQTTGISFIFNRHFRLLKQWSRWLCLVLFDRFYHKIWKKRYYTIYTVYYIYIILL